MVRYSKVSVWLFAGEIDYNSDVVQGLRGYSKSDKKTFAYYFTERYLPPTENREWNLPDWAKLSAIYADQLPFMWGYVYTKENPEMLQGYQFIIKTGVPTISGLGID